MRADIYCRVSTQSQETDGTSLDSQEQRARQHCDAHGYTVGVVVREAHSGAELWERPQLSVLRDRVRAGQTDVVVCYAIDRLARDQRHLTVLLVEAERYGARYEFVTESIDTSPEGWLIQNVKGYVAEVERYKIRERTMRGKAERLKQGRLAAPSVPPYGYTWRDARKSGLVIDPTQAPVVQVIYQLCRAGQSMRAISLELQDRHLAPPRGGRRWSRGLVWRILTNPVYKGVAYANRWDRAGGRYRLRPPAEWVRLPDDYAPPIIPPAEWEAAQQAQAQHVRDQRRRMQYPEAFLLRGGYAVCARCGSYLVTQTARYLRKDGRETPNHYYRCNLGQRTGGRECGLEQHRADRLDRAVWHWLELRVRDPKRLFGDDGLGPTRTNLAAVEAALAKLADQQRALVRELANVPAAVAGLVRDEIAALDAQRVGLADQRAALAATLEAAQARADLEARFDEFAAWLVAPPSYATKRALLAAAGVRVRVEPDGRWQPEAVTGFHPSQTVEPSHGPATRLREADRRRQATTWIPLAL